MKVTKACSKVPPYDKLVSGDRIAVQCDIEAFSNEEKHDDRQSENEISESYHSYSKNSENETIEKEKRETKTPKYRCKGDGSIGRNTRFQSLADPTCKGKWMRLTNHSRKCRTDPQFIFV